MAPTLLLAFVYSSMSVKCPSHFVSFLLLDNFIYTSESFRHPADEAVP